MPNSRAFRSSVSTCTRESWSRMCAAVVEPSVGTLWSAVASVRSRRRTGRPSMRSDSKACGEVTSCTRCRSMYSRLSATSWACQILSNRLLGKWCSAPPESGGHDSVEAGVPGSGVLEVMRDVGVEGHGVALDELVLHAGADEPQRALHHDRGLAAAGLVHRGVVGLAGGAARRQRVQGHLGAQARQRRRQDLVAVAAGPDVHAVVRAHHGHPVGLVEPEQLRQRQLEPAGDALGHRQRRAGLAALDLGEHRRGHAAAIGEIPKREVHALTEAADPGTKRMTGGGHAAAYVITDACMLPYRLWFLGRTRTSLRHTCGGRVTA